MVLYLDTSALLKRYVTEAESEDVLAKMDNATAIATALITRTEVAAALSKAQRETRIDLRKPDEPNRSSSKTGPTSAKCRSRKDWPKAQASSRGAANCERTTLCNSPPR